MGKRRSMLGLLCLSFSILAVLSACLPARQTLSSARLVDLTYAFEESTVYWPTSKEFRLERVFQGTTDMGFFYAANNFTAAEHGGTHVDAPFHFHAGGDTTDRIPLQRLIGPGAVIDVSEQCRRNRDYQVRVEDLMAWERSHGVRLYDRIVLLRTGFGSYWPDRGLYMGTAQRGPEAVPQLHFPGLHPEAARWLASQRKIRAVGLDTPSIDYGQSKSFASHVGLFEKNIPVFENVANLHKLPEAGFTVVALPMKIKNGTGGPLRIVAVLE